MAYILGIDTGGTYTDSVIICTKEQRVVRKSKAITTRENLTEGITNSIDQLDGIAEIPIDMVCLSTTLATNAIVEGQGGKVGLLLIGKDPGLKLPVEVQSVLEGCLDIKGREIVPFDEMQARQMIRRLRSRADAVAVSGYASVRNPRHELMVKQIVKEELKVPVVCAHELSGNLGFEERTATVVFNARLIPVIRRLIQAVKTVLSSRGINAPVMTVKGDGSLMGEEFALARPVETILSGPAASVIGGAFLSKEKDALILDMGGTTTDIAALCDGKVKLNDDGAVIGGFKTRVRAAEILTFGIGGDSYIRSDGEKKLLIGPKRATPLCVAAGFYPWLVDELMEAARNRTGSLSDIQIPECFMARRDQPDKSLSAAEARILDILQDGPHGLPYIISQTQNGDTRIVWSMEEKGILARIAVTPTDILHVTGSFRKWNTEASQLGSLLLGRQMDKTREELTEDVLELMTKKLMSACRTSSAGHETERPVVAIGNPVGAWMPKVCHELGRNLIIPEHSEVANAVGAAVGQVMYDAEVLIRVDRQNECYIVHSPWDRTVKDTLDEAKEYVRPLLKNFVREMLESAGAADSQIIINEKEVYTTNIKECRSELVEVRMKATGIGSPGW
ncbi:hydantoinase/oxoprolinase family protein [Ruminococcus sp. OA3]|uniref:hydantoinase/oxoprolinase family protein n=1 Tax=Ruminococcus sp. OA3 TaxID=2914164 RepID=UPI001F06B35D|nr:hydantoinase/oxoprolinase family protein [Ruminococcus sp. OA3]MCH1981708.1 hydantoinase/oxoprolinase family protein [Ruminococcus sp. OA3]